jgi:hypothetical protein
MADAESTWVLRRFAQHTETSRLTHHAETVSEAIDRYLEVCGEVDEVVADTADLSHLCPSFDAGQPVNLLWILGHLLEETARHAGHADILREMLDGSTGR